MSEPTPRITQHPILLGAALVWTGWLVLMITGDRWSLFLDNAFMSVTMLFGSFIAGATSEGGGAVAFPVMTLVFGIAPDIARDFSLIIQSVGMMAAAFTIFCLRIPTEPRAILFASLGGALGVVLGLEFIAPVVPPAYAKILFTSVWLSFAIALLLINRAHDRPVFAQIPRFKPSHGVLLLAIGVVGGCISSVTGSGLDILTFSVLVLGFRVDEKVATPTSVVLMGLGALVGGLWKGLVGDGIAPEAWDYWFVCVPIVVIGAPLGAWFIRDRSRAMIVGFLIVSIVVQYIAAQIIIPQTTTLLVFNLLTVVAGVALFTVMGRFGSTRSNSRL